MSKGQQAKQDISETYIYIFSVLDTLVEQACVVNRGKRSEQWQVLLRLFKRGA